MEHTPIYPIGRYNHCMQYIELSGDIFIGEEHYTYQAITWIKDGEVYDTDLNDVNGRAPCDLPPLVEDTIKRECELRAQETLTDIFSSGHIKGGGA